MGPPTRLRTRRYSFRLCLLTLASSADFNGHETSLFVEQKRRGRTKSCLLHVAIYIYYCRLYQHVLNSAIAAGYTARMPSTATTTPMIRNTPGCCCTTGMLPPCPSHFYDTVEKTRFTCSASRGRKNTHTCIGNLGVVFVVTL